MTKCTDSGCRNLQTTCSDCGRTVCTKNFSQIFINFTNDELEEILMCLKQSECEYGGSSDIYSAIHKVDQAMTDEP